MEMNTRSGPNNSSLFLGLAATQAAHSIEEYLFNLFDVFEPARFLIGLVAEDLALGFAVVNTMVVAFIFWTYFFRIRPESPNARAWIWGWSLVGLANGIGHILLAINAGAYFPGVVTAPLLVLFSLALIYRLVHPVGRQPV